MSVLLNRYYYMQNDDDNKDDDENQDDELDIPYSSSSVDRSSIGSIPWADDAIKQNQLDWERVERMLSSEESLPEETDLANEILEWQTKFPQLVNMKKSQTFGDSMDIDSLSNLSISSLHNDDDADCNFEYDSSPTTKEIQSWNSIYDFDHKLKSIGFKKYIGQLSQPNSIPPIKISKRQQLEFQRNSDHVFLSESSGSTPVRFNSTLQVNKTRNMQHIPEHETLINKSTNGHVPISSGHLRMPPILNVLESKRRFCGTTSDSSFVQLTEIQPVKATSAVPPDQKWRFGNKNKAWYIPHTAGKLKNTNNYFNNRNAIILPAISLPHTSSTPSSSSEFGGQHRSTNSAMLSNGPRQQHNFDKRNLHNLSVVSTTSSTGRSISAATHHARIDLCNLYVPYSASKFKSFK